MKRLPLTLGLCLALVPVGQARQEPQSCATHPEIGKERLYLHRQARRARVAAAAARPAAARDIGQIAILEDTDGVVGRLNPFNLDQRTVAFTPAAALAARYRFRTQEASYDAPAAQAGTRIDLGDDDTKPVTLPFPFPFFGASQQRMFVNSDGNLTFTSGDNTSSERSLGRVTAGPPRIARLFRDLDPSMSPEGVRVLLEQGRVVVSWSKVPEYRDTGIGPLQTFQVRLYPDGRIEFAFDGVSTRDAVVGISPGRLQGSSSVVSFAGGSDVEYSSTVAERFSGDVEIDVVTAAQKFYETHEDAYDYLVFFNNLGIDAGGTAVAYEMTVRTGREGIGDKAVDVGSEYGSASRLQSVLNMGPLSQYPADPTPWSRAASRRHDHERHRPRSRPPVSGLRQRARSRRTQRPADAVLGPGALELRLQRGGVAGFRQSHSRQRRGRVAPVHNRRHGRELLGAGPLPYGFDPGPGGASDVPGAGRGERLQLPAHVRRLVRRRAARHHDRGDRRRRGTADARLHGVAKALPVRLHSGGGER